MDPDRDKLELFQLGLTTLSVSLEIIVVYVDPTILKKLDLCVKGTMETERISC